MLKDGKITQAQYDEASEHALHRAILFGHTLDRKGVP
jgi:hypothetical protein